MYLLDILGPTDATPQDSLYSPDITVTGWSKRINAPGKFVFSMHKDNPSATDETLQMWRGVRLYRTPRDGTNTLLKAWFGVIISKREVGDRIEVLCAGGLKIFAKRYTGGNESFTGAGSTEAFGLLSDTNANDGPTGISQGTGGVATTLNLTLDSIDIQQAFEQIAAATDAEFEVDDDALLNFVPSLGSDKSATIELIFQRDSKPGSNVVSIEIAEDGEPMANKVIGTTTASSGLTSTYTHPTSTPTYPVLVDHKTFNTANNQTTLDALTEAFGLQRGLPVPDFQAVPATATKKFNTLTGQREIAGLQYGDVEVGDLVLVTIITANRNISVVKRIAELIVDVDENLNEKMRFTLTTTGVFVTEQYLGESELPDIKRRIQRVEAQL